jgi:hypothetical protein
MTDHVPSPSDQDDDPIASILDRVLAERDARLEASGTFDLAVPTWDGRMVATYGHLGEVEFDRFVARLGPDQKPSLAQAQDVLIAAVRAIALVDPETGTKTEIAKGYTRPLARRLAQLDDDATARQIVLYMMGGRAMNVAEHAGEVIAFLQGGADDVERHLTGESATS